MTYAGHVIDGKVVFDGPAPLPDGAAVTVEAAAPAAEAAQGPARRWRRSTRDALTPRPGTPDSTEMIRGDRDR